MNDNDGVTSLWYDTTDTWGVTVVEANDENVVNSVIAVSFEFPDLEF